MHRSDQLREHLCKLTFDGYTQKWHKTYPELYTY